MDPKMNDPKESEKLVETLFNNYKDVARMIEHCDELMCGANATNYDDEGNREDLIDVLSKIMPSQALSIFGEILIRAANKGNYADVMRELHPESTDELTS